MGGGERAEGGGHTRWTCKEAVQVLEPVERVCSGGGGSGRFRHGFVDEEEKGLEFDVFGHCVWVLRSGHGAFIRFFEDSIAKLKSIPPTRPPTNINSNSRKQRFIGLPKK